MIQIKNHFFEKSNIYDTIEEKSDKIWKYQRYFLVFEFVHKPIILPPFNILYYFGFMIAKLINIIKNKNNIENLSLKPTGYCKFLNIISFKKIIFYFKKKDYEFRSFDEMTRLSNWEIFLANELVSRIDKEQKNSIDFKIKQKEEKYKFK
jgi:hypothetical protein